MVLAVEDGMKRYAWLALVALIGCGSSPGETSPSASFIAPTSRFRVLHAEGDGVWPKLMVRVLEDTKTGECYVYAMTGQGGGIVVATRETCR